MTAIHPQYLTNTKGKKISVLLPLKEFNTILEELEELEDIKLYDQSKNDNEPSFPKNIAMEMIEVERKKIGF
ncbi:MAG: hypothetical protein EAZ53_03125 [Bacteroidetes bacterium]|nr:MAG: hypothetical protein EAZ53_03125 [Bacteroidota bacterium]